MYEVPSQYFRRVHHVRPRFKNNVEAVLLYISDSMVNIGTLPSSEFNEEVIKSIYNFPGNQNKALKTMQNWRTEISALFSLYYEDGENSVPSLFAEDLTTNQDTTKFFKYFLYSFQYPGGHVKPKEIQKYQEDNILFHPTNYILRVIKALQEVEKKQAYITKGEVCHLIFNDLRATTDFKYEYIPNLITLIINNRSNNIEYDLTGDVIRYAGDIIDYMVLANLIKNFAGKYYINSSESKAIQKYLDNNLYFEYDKELSTAEIAALEEDWVIYSTVALEDKIFDSDILAFIAEDESDYKLLQDRTNYIQAADVPESGARTKDIGDYGENLVYGHECMFLKNANREDLINWVQCIPNHFAVGYDIQSVDPQEIKRYIEVKSTISTKTITFNRFKLTKNELSSAQTLGENYFVYRLQIHKTNDKPIVKLNIIKNPIQLFKEDKIDINLMTGEVNLKSFQGKNTELLFWKEKNE